MYNLLEYSAVNDDDEANDDEKKMVMPIIG